MGEFSKKYFLFIFVFILLISILFSAEVPNQVKYQGYIEVNGVPFNGVGLFKFAIINADGTQTLWSNDGTSVAGGIPQGEPISIEVSNGIFFVLLGNTEYTNMTEPLTPEALESGITRLSIWFDGGKGFQRLFPDKLLDSVPYTLKAGVTEKIIFPIEDPITSPPPNLLPRESVWPDHEGRSDNIVSQLFVGMNSVSESTFTVPADRRFVITDLQFNVPGSTGQYRLFYTLDSQEKTLLYTSITGYKEFSFKAGLAVPPEGALQVEFSGSGVNQYLNVTGFEYPYP